MTDTVPWIFDVTAQEFQEKVLMKSAEMPVIVDFWAPWCQPCLQLGPILEKLVQEAGGRILMAKVNIDEEQQLAMMARVQSIPMVMAFIGGQVADHFMGVQPEPQLRQWVQSLLPSKAQELVTKALELEATDQSSAEAMLRESLELEANDGVRIHLARLLVAQSRDAEAKEIIDALEARGWLEPEAQAVKSQLEMRAMAEESGGVLAARKAVEDAPGDPHLQIHLADALAVDGRHRDAFELLLSVVETHRGSDPANAAREQMVNLFNVLGSGNALVGEYRRRLATALY